MKRHSRHSCAEAATKPWIPVYVMQDYFPVYNKLCKLHCVVCCVFYKSWKTVCKSFGVSVII